MIFFKKLIYYAIVIYIICFILNANANSFNQQEAATSIKSILSQATKTSIKQLGVTGGFSNNPELRIALPSNLANIANLLERLGLKTQLGQLEKGMNAAAEAAIPEAQEMVINSIKQMTFNDAKQIITGGDTAATAYLEKTNRTALFNKFLPKVKTITDQYALAANYNSLIKRTNLLGITNNNMTIENYVTHKTLDGLFNTIKKQESYLRHNPAAITGKIAKKLVETLN